MERVLFYDIECFADYFLLSTKCEGERKDFESKNNSIDRKEFTDFFKEHRDSLLVSYNGLDYDNQLITLLLDPNRSLTTSDLFSLSKRIIEDGEKVYPERLGRLCFDLSYWSFRWLPPDEKGNFKRQYTALKDLGIEFGFTNILDCPVPFSQAKTSEDDRARIREYCHNDVDLTESIFNSQEVQAWFDAASRISELFNIPKAKIYTMTDATIAENAIRFMLGDAYEKKKEDTPYSIRDIVDKNIAFKTEAFNNFFDIVKNWDKEKGALHVVLNVGQLPLSFGLGGLHGAISAPFVFIRSKEEYLLDIDADSYYPSLVANLNIAPIGLEKEYPDVFRQFKKMKESARTKAERETYKLIINSSTGKLKNPGSLFYSPRTNEAITINGQLILLELIESLHEEEFSIIAANTDGLTIRMTQEKVDKLIHIVFEWESKWKMNLKQAVFDCYIHENVNSFHSLTSDGTVKQRGAFKRGKKETYPCVSNTAIEYLLNQEIDVEKRLRELPFHSFVKRVKRDSWSIEGDEIPMRSSGVNMIYQAVGIHNSLLALYKNEIQKTVGTNVMTNNDGKEIPRDTIDYEAYYQLVMKFADKFAGRREPPRYEAPVSIRAINTKDSFLEKDRKLFINLLLALGYISSSNQDRMDRCPIPSCEADIGGSKSVKIYGDSAYCFRCNTYISMRYIESLAEPDAIGDARRKIASENVIAEEKAAENMNVEDVMAEEEKEESAPINQAGKTPISSYKPPPVIYSGEKALPPVIWQGYLKDFADICDSRGVNTLFCALSSASALIHEEIDLWYGGSPLRGNNYYLSVAESGTGKSGKMNLIKEAIGSSNYYANIASGQALFDMISSEVYEGIGKARKLVGYKAERGNLLVDEFATVLKAIHIPGSELAPRLLETHTCYGWYSSLSRGNKRESGFSNKRIFNPTLTVTGISTRDTVINPSSGFTKELQTNGLVNRFLFFPSDEVKLSRLYYTPRKRNRFLADLKPNRALKGAYMQPDIGTASFYPKEVNLFLDPHIDRLQTEYVERKDREFKCQMSRLHAHLHRLVLMYGMMTGNKKPTVENARGAVAVIELCEAFTKELFREMMGSVQNNQSSTLRNSVEDSFYYFYDKWAPNGEEVSIRDIKKAMKQRGCGGYDFENIIKFLTSGDDPQFEILSGKQPKGGFPAKIIRRVKK